MGGYGAQMPCDGGGEQREDVNSARDKDGKMRNGDVVCAKGV